MRLQSQLDLPIKIKVNNNIKMLNTIFNVWNTTINAKLQFGGNGKNALNFLYLDFHWNNQHKKILDTFDY